MYRIMYSSETSTLTNVFEVVYTVTIEYTQAECSHRIHREKNELQSTKRIRNEYIRRSY